MMIKIIVKSTKDVNEITHKKRQSVKKIKI